MSDPGSSQGYNRYSYTSNNPINYIDPSGHKATVCSPGDACGGQYLTGPGGLAENDQKLATLTYDSTGKKQERNQQIAETVLDKGTELALTTIAPPVGLLYQVVSERKITAWDLAFAFFPSGLVDDLGKGVAKAVGKYGDEAVDLFRAVSPEELNDIERTGLFRVNANNGYEFGKWFATSSADAEKWGAAFYKDSKSFSVVRGQIPRAALEGAFYVSSLDGIGPAYNLSTDLLNLVNIIK